MKGALWALNVPVFGMSFINLMKILLTYSAIAKYAISGMASKRPVTLQWLIAFCRTDARARSCKTFVWLSTQ